MTSVWMSSRHGLRMHSWWKLFIRKSRIPRFETLYAFKYGIKYKRNTSMLHSSLTIRYKAWTKDSRWRAAQHVGGKAAWENKVISRTLFGSTTTTAPEPLLLQPSPFDDRNTVELPGLLVPLFALTLLLAFRRRSFLDAVDQTAVKLPFRSPGK